MPSPTFVNLPDAKKERFIQEALKEFSEKSYEQASVSKIVRRLNIAKGSVYQYFTDKSDLYQYLVNTARKRKTDIFLSIYNQPDQDFDIWFTRLCLAEIKFSAEFSEMHNLLENEALINPSASSEQLFLLRKEVDHFGHQMRPGVDHGKLAFILKATKDALVSQKWPHQGVSDYEILDNISEVVNLLFSKFSKQ
ncbi:TetR/AcrR family transcriptional regulator [Fulvivirga ligni]|uniref:TetR/AcrR family transcriptional regulator n=1 Tax=Fulvivirga ligni TaxID=2904246 RepID=UPI001F33A0EC|nr:TetR/AcrR family transcriptional regulator [Fulvivirga ligni]UII22156.1 TetR/AcrR family transcriptional regulator [Fulvivirga ligni]